jgi:nitrite reductase (NO-forming)
MRFVFPIVILVAVILGLWALFTHRPGRIAEQIPVQPQMQQPPAAPSPQSSGAPQASAVPPSPAPRQPPASTLPPGGKPQAASGTAQSPPITISQHGHLAAASPPAPSPSQQAAAQPAVGHGDAAEGRKIFRKCQACHSLQPGKEMIGPSLSGVIGRKSGVEPGFNHSQAMKQANITWDAGTLGAYLTDPQKTVPGNRMPFPGLNPSTTGTT